MLRCPCELSTVCKSPMLTYSGQPHPEILVIGAYPSEVDDKRGELFSDSTGDYIRDLLDSFGVRMDKVGYTNVVSCHYEKAHTKKYVSACTPVLLKTLKEHTKNTKLIILVGSLPTKTFLNKAGMEELSGKIHRIGNIYHMPIKEPSKLATAAQKKQLARDMQKALGLIRLNMEQIIDGEVVDATRLRELLPILRRAKKITFDVETSSLDMYDSFQYIVGIGFCYDVMRRKACFVPLEHPELRITAQEYRARVELIREIMQNPVPKEGFNGGFDLQWLDSYLDIPIGSVNYQSDPMHEYHFIKETVKGGTLSNLTLEYLPDMGGYDAEMDSLEVQHGGKRMAFFPLDKIATYCMGDCVASARLSEEQFDDKLQEEGSWKQYKEIVIPVVPLYAEMQHRGTKLDIPLCEQTEEAYSVMTAKLHTEAMACKVVKDKGKNLSLTSPPQMVEFLYKTLKLPEQKESSKKPDGSHYSAVSAGAKAIEALLNMNLDKDVTEFLYAYSDFKRIHTIQNKYASRWRDWIGSDGYVHTNYYLSGTVTGRLSSSNPNLQNMPRPEVDETTEVTRFLKQWPIKRLFISKFENGNLVEADYSQLELRLMAALSRDEIMVGTYRDGLNGGDLHHAMAITQHPNFHEVSKDLQKQWRTDAKTLNFKGGYSLDEVFLSAYPGLRAYVERIQADAISQGYITTAYGRRRRLPNVQLTVPDKAVKYMTPEERNNFFRRLSALRQAVNTTIQEPGHTTLETALKRVVTRFREEKLKGHLVLEVHDSLTADCPLDETERICEIMKDEMEGVQDNLDWLNGVPLIVEVEVGKNWYDKEGVK